MAEHLVNLDELLIQASQHLLTPSQISDIQLIQTSTNRDFLEILIQENFINNEFIIEIMAERYPALILLDVPKKSILDYVKLEEYTKNGYFIFKENNEECIAINNLAILQQALKTQGLKKVKLIRKSDFLHLLQREFNHLNTIKSKYFLDFIPPNSTAKNIDYIKSILGFLIFFFISFVGFIKIFHIINSVIYFVQNFFKFFLFKCATNINSESSMKIAELSDPSLPIYTILIPLYKERKTLQSIIQSITALNYPKNKLDVKMILEVDDYELCDAVNNIKLPFYIEVIKVPFSLPRTKPKALNFAFAFCRGQYLVIYDAEDIPDPNQLLLAVGTFNSLPPEYACLQAKLNFYNSEENLLTKFMSLEYGLWFDYLLNGLSSLRLPVPLGGTSNHFKTDVLAKIGLWDSYNVTEDADLGIRLYLNGYRTSMINSYTLEEAPFGLKNWIRQRARWIKGFIQTFLVFVYSKNGNSKIRYYPLFTIYVIIGLTPYIFFALPWILLAIYINTHSFIDYMWLLNSLFGFLYSYYSTGCLLLKQKKKFSKLTPLDCAAFVLWPFYFILHTISSYLAIWESLVRPFSWYKTKHGAISKK